MTWRTKPSFPSNLEVRNMAESNLKKILQEDKEKHPMPKAFEEKLRKDMEQQICDTCKT